MTVFAVVEIYGSIFQSVEVFATREDAMKLISEKREEMGDMLDPDCTCDSAISLNMEEEWRMCECTVRGCSKIKPPKRKAKR